MLDVRTVLVPVALTAAALVCVPACHVHWSSGSSAGVSMSSGNRVEIGEVSRSIPVAEGLEEVSLRNGVGDIEVLPSDGRTIEVTATVKICSSRADEMRPASFDRDIAVQTGGGALRLEDAHMKDSDHNDWAIDWKVRVPAGVRLTVSDGVGDVTVAGLEGAQTLKTGVGDIDARSERPLTGPGEYKSGTGDVKVVLGGTSGAVEAATGVGDVALTLAGAPGNQVEAKSGTGDVRVQVATSFDGRIDFATGVGALNLTGAEGVHVQRNVVGGTARGPIGTGAGVLVRARTGVGDVEFKREGEGRAAPVLR